VSPAPLPGPPEDYTLLVEFPFLDEERLPEVLFRVHRLDHEPQWFVTTGTGRFDPPALAADPFGLCYLAVDPVTALMEAFGDLPLVTQDMVDARAMAMVRLLRAQKLADMTSPLIVGRWRLDRRISTGDDYPVCQRWAHSLRLAGFAGIYYEPRHDPRRKVQPASVALFADPGLQPQTMVLADDGPISSEVILTTKKAFGLRVLRRTTLPPPPWG
jgi:hypothetical protein